MVLRTALLLTLAFPVAAAADPAPQARPYIRLASVPLPMPRPDGLAAPEQAVPPPEEAAPEPEAVPMPAPRPDNIVIDFGPFPVPPGFVEAEVPPDPLPDPLCDELEASGEAEFERLDRIMEGQCGAWTPIRLKALTPMDGERVELEMPVTMNCKVLRATLDWLGASAQPAARKQFGSPIARLRQTGGYECRGRNRDPSARMSEHGLANALDIGGFELGNGKVVPVQTGSGDAERSFLKEIREAACGIFTTVLGPGVAAHDEHFHFDLARRGKSKIATYCR